MTIDGFEITGPVIAFGVITGLLYGLLAVGLVLVYRQSRVINFAEGQIGAFGATLVGLGVVVWHLPFYLIFPVALAASAGVGGLTEVVIIRRLRHAPALISVIATLGLAQFLAVFESVINATATSTSTFPEPPGFPQFSLGPLLVTRSSSAMLILSPIIVVGLVIFLRKSRLGIQMRATAANYETAQMMGIRPGRTASMAWAIAGAFACFTTILILPNYGYTDTSFLGPDLLVRALAAAVIARMESLPIALIAGIGIGVIERVIEWNYPIGGDVEPVLLVIILVALFLQRRRTGRDEEKGVWASVRPWSRIPDALRQSLIIRYFAWIVFALACVLGVVLPLVTSATTTLYLIYILSFGLIGISLGIVTSLGGQLSLGQLTVAGGGAAAGFVVSEHVANFALALLVAGITSALISLAIGLPALRIRGLMLVVTTLSFAVVGEAWLFQQNWMFGTNGVATKTPTIGPWRFGSVESYYFLTFAVLLVGLWIARNVWVGGLGRRLRAVRDNEDAARSFALGSTTIKLQAFMLSGFIAGLGGLLFFNALTLPNAASFSISSNIDVAGATALGGVGFLFGPLIGAFYIIGIPQFVPLDQAGLSATALGWLFIVVQFPGGLAQMFARTRRTVIDWLARRSGIDPSCAWDRSAGADSRAGEAISTVDVSKFRNVQHHQQVEVAEVLLAAKGLEKRFGGLRAVDSVDLEVRYGETLGLIGPNGAGKTTLFELLSGFTRPNSGSVEFLGKDITHLRSSRRSELGLIRSFQEALLFRHLRSLKSFSSRWIVTPRRDSSQVSWECRRIETVRNLAMHRSY